MPKKIRQNRNRNSQKEFQMISLELFLLLKHTLKDRQMNTICNLL